MDTAHKVDRLRVTAKRMIEEGRLILKNQERTLQHIFGIGSDKVNALRSIEVAAAVNSVLAYHGMASDGQCVSLSAASAISTTDCYPFIFDDEDLVEDILSSDIKAVPVDSIKLPHSNILIELPKPVPFPDGSGDVWDIAYIGLEESLIHNGKRLPSGEKEVFSALSGETSHRELTWVCMAYDSRKNFDSNYFWFFPKRHEQIVAIESVIDPAAGETAVRDKIISKAVIQLLKLVLFLTSPSASVRTVKRCRPSHKAPAAIKARFPTTNIVTFNKEHVNYEYEDEGDIHGRYTVRFRVKGHFKVFRKGVLSGRVLWCRPHWKGPDIGQQVERKYLV